MRLVVWNCHQALHRKTEFLASLRPDVTIVPECASPMIPKLSTALQRIGVTCSAWNGKNQNKGLGVFLFNNFAQTDEPKTAGGSYSLTMDLELEEKTSLIALWTQGPGYIEEAHRSVEHYKNFFRGQNTIVAGDLNSNTIWDSSRVLNHSQFVRRLA